MPLSSVKAYEGEMFVIEVGTVAEEGVIAVAGVLILLVEVEATDDKEAAVVGSDRFEAETLAARERPPPSLVGEVCPGPEAIVPRRMDLIVVGLAERLSCESAGLVGESRRACTGWAQSGITISTCRALASPESVEAWRVIGEVRVRDVKGLERTLTTLLRREWTGSRPLDEFLAGCSEAYGVMTMGMCLGREPSVDESLR